MTTTIEDVEAALLGRWPENRITPTLDRMTAVLELLGNPHRSVPAIHIAGTNGKTSTARMIDGLLQESKYRVGRYTSPHLVSVRERIVLDGKPIDEATFIGLYQRVLPAVEKVDYVTTASVSFFEFLTVMAFVGFAEARVDVAVVEVGLGGRWDATNVVFGRVTVITPVSLDHTEYLGPDVGSIAQEKAGIIKPNTVAVTAAQLPQAGRVLAEQAQGAQVPLEFAPDRFRLTGREIKADGQLLQIVSGTVRFDNLWLPLLGRYQAENAQLALLAVDTFLRRDGSHLQPATARRALRGVRSPGRFERFAGEPAIVVDGSHNPGKDIAGIVRALEPVTSTLVATAAVTPRAVPAAELAAAAARVLGGNRVRCVSRLRDAIAQAVALAERARATGPAVVLITGSVITAGQASSLLNRCPTTDKAPTGHAAADVLLSQC
jgi:dihydrofolate synthase/folylpolyglutamate synthase